MARLIVTPPAQTDIEDIIDYLARVAGRAVAERHASNFYDAFGRLTDFPGIGAPRPQFGADMRVWSVAPYLIFYRHSANGAVRVVRILDGRRNITGRLFPNM